MPERAATPPPSPLDDVPLEASPGVQARLNLTERTRTNPLPWRGQFSPELVEWLLRTFAPRPAGSRLARVLDPFAGVGTTLWEAARLGHDAAGAEINPAAVTMGGALRLLPMRLPEREAQIERARARLRTLQDTSLSDLARAAREARDDPQRVILENTVLRLGGPAKANSGAPIDRALDAFARALRALPLAPASVRATLHHADARRVPVPPGSIDLVLTSPPYVNVFNYHQQARRAVEALGWDVLPIARSELGANRKHRSNRFLTVIQYALDMAQWLLEMRRVLRPRGGMIVVVGRVSSVRSVPIHNAALLATLADRAAFRLARRHQRRFTTRFGESIYEDVLHLERLDAPDRLAAGVLPIARDTAAALLAHALAFAPAGDVVRDLRAALAGADAVQPSPLFEPSPPPPTPAPQRPRPRSSPARRRAPASAP